jgi:hypothetical protein
MELMIDFNTLDGDSIRPVIIEVATLRFDRDRFTSDNPYDIPSLLRDVKSFGVKPNAQVANGRIINAQTLEYWQSTDVGVLTRSKSGISVEEVCEHLNAQAEKATRVWLKNAAYHGTILRTLFEDAAIKPRRELTWQNLSESTSFLAAGFGIGRPQQDIIPVQMEERWGTDVRLYKASHDVMAEVMKMQMIARFEYDMEQVNGW